MTGDSRRGPWHRRRGPRAAMVALWALMAIVSVNAPAYADIELDNQIRAAVDAADGVQLYDYQSATDAVFDLPSDWDAGTYSDTARQGDEVHLDRYGAVGPQTASWWDTAWRTRRCYAIDNPDTATALTEYQVRVEVDVSNDLVQSWIDPAGDDLRGLAADDVTVLPLWIQSVADPTAWVVWVQVPAVPAGDGTSAPETSFCLYSNHDTGVPTVSDEDAVFRYSSPTPLYHPVSERYTGAGAAGTVDVVSSVDGNQVQLNGVGPVTALNAGDTATFTGVGANDVLWAAGPLQAIGRANGQDVLVPVSFASTAVVHPTSRGTQRFSLVAPYVPATVRIYNGAAVPANLRWSGVVNPGAATAVVADVTGNRVGTIVSDQPILATHVAQQGWDALLAPPWYGDDLFGVRSRQALYGSATAVSYSVLRSDNTTNSYSQAAGTKTVVNVGSDLDGDGTAVRVTGAAGGAVGGIQQADRDGFESSAFFPERLLSNDYWLPARSNYVAFACPDPTTVIEVRRPAQPAVTLNCDLEPGPPLAGAPGHAVFGDGQADLGTLPAGTQLVSTTGQPFYVYFERFGTDDESNLLPKVGARKLALLEPVPTVGPVEGLYRDSGTWASAVSDTGVSGIYGALASVATLPTNTTITFQIASGATTALAAAATPVGPDGTSATFYTTDTEVIAYAHDLDQFVRVVAYLSTNDPTVTPALDTLSLGTDLPELAAPDVTTPTAIAVASPVGAVTRTFIARVYGEVTNGLAGSGAVVRHDANGGLGALDNMTVWFPDNSSNQVTVTFNTLTQTVGAPIPFGPGQPHSIAVDALMSGPTAEMDVTWRSEGSGPSPVVEHPFRLTFSG